MSDQQFNFASADIGQRQRMADPELAAKHRPGDRRVRWAALPEAAVIFVFNTALVHGPDRKEGAAWVTEMRRRLWAACDPMKIDCVASEVSVIGPSRPF
jgi:hypothetical protein